jgi:uncharacterized protein with PIN domain
MNEDVKKENCPNCNKKIENPIERKIIEVDKSAYKRASMGIKETKMIFCCNKCGMFYQMGVTTKNV